MLPVVYPKESAKTELQMAMAPLAVSTAGKHRALKAAAVQN